MREGLRGSGRDRASTTDDAARATSPTDTPLSAPLSGQVDKSHLETNGAVNDRTKREVSPNIELNVSMSATRDDTPNLPAALRATWDLLRHSHRDAGSLPQGLLLKFDILRALVRGNGEYLSRHWDEVYIQESSHHDGTVEFIRSRGQLGEPRAVFSMVGVPTASLLAFKASFESLRKQFPATPPSAAGELPIEFDVPHSSADR